MKKNIKNNDTSTLLTEELGYKANYKQKRYFALMSTGYPIKDQ